MSVKDTASKARKWQPNENITEEELKSMREEVHERVITARVGLLLRHPFFGNMATRLKVQNCDEWCPTAATDGRNLYYNTQFFNAMSNKEIEFVIAHEILHCVYDHLVRREDRDPRLYNVAADYIVNNLLVRERIGEKPKIINCYQDFKYEGWTSEEAYDDLYKEAQKNGKDFLDQLGEMLDEHYDWESGDSDDESSDGNGKGRPRYSKEELGQIKDEIKEAMIQASNSAGASNTPAGIQRLIKDLTEPKMNWRELLRQQIQSTIRSDYTFAHPNRKGWHSGAILPGMNFDETIDICVALDMSGSIGESQARDFLSEIKGIMEEYKDFKITVWCFDTKVYNMQEFTADGGDELTDYEIYGGGGTDFMCNWTFMKDEDVQPKKFLMFTDMYAFDSFGDPDYCDTIFINHGRPNFEAPFGITAEYKE